MKAASSGGLRRRTGRRVTGVLMGVLAMAVTQGGTAHAVQAVFDPAGTAFFDVPFPYELRRDADGTVSLAGFPFPKVALAQTYASSLEETEGFGVNSAVFAKFDGAIDAGSLPPDPDASRRPGASVFLINIDPQARHHGERIPLWLDFRPVGDQYRGPNLLVAMPVPGHPLEAGALYALVLTDALRATDGTPVGTPPFMQHMRGAQASGDYETASLPLYDRLWQQLEGEEGLSREHVVSATVYRTGTPTRGMLALGDTVRAGYGAQLPTDIAFNRNADTYWIVVGNIIAPQFQTGMPPFTSAPSGRILFDGQGQPQVQREDTLQFVLAIPKETADGSISLPAHGWPIVEYQHGTGGDRFSFVREGIAGTLAAVGIASISTDAPLHGIRPGGDDDGNDFYNPQNPYALRDNTRQAAAEGVLVHELVPHLSIDAALFNGAPGDGFRAPSGQIVFDADRRMFMGHSQGAANGPLVMASVRNLRGGVLSAASSHLLLNVLTREADILPGVKLRQLVSLLLGTPIDVFHPALHMLEMGGEVSENDAFAHLLNRDRDGGPLSVLFTNGLLDDQVPTPLVVALVAAARYPLIGPLFPVPVFPTLPGYSYAEPFALAGLNVDMPPVSGNVPGPPPATGGLLLFPHDGHYAIFDNDTAHQQYQEFLRSLAYDDQAVVPPGLSPQCAGDCDGDGTVSIDELVRGVTIALGDHAVDTCPAFDRDGNLAVTVDELLGAVGNALTACSR